MTARDEEHPETEPSKAERDAVGYGRPPKHTQFKPGVSGNPKGRPKIPRSLGAALEAFLSEKAKVTEDGRKRRIPKRDVIAKQLVNKAAGGDLSAIRLLTQILEANALAKAKSEGNASNQPSEADEAVIAALITRFGGPAT